MSRVYIATQGWGVLQDPLGNVMPGQSATLKNRDGSNATHYSARTAGTSSTASITSSATGLLERWADPGEYVLSVGGTDYDVEAASGTVGLLNVLGEGVLAGDTGDQSTALQAADTKARTEGRILYIPPNLTFRITSPVRFTTALIARGAIINYAGASPVAGAVKVGANGAASALRGVHMELPEVTQNTKTWVGTDVGVVIEACFDCHIWVPHIKDFSIGLDLRGLAGIAAQGGCAYNTFYIGHLENNQINQRLAPVAIDAYVNQNTFIGGQWSHQSAETDAGTKHIQLVHGGVVGDGWLQPNNNVWLNPSLEGFTVEYDIDCDGANNVWFNARHEGDGSVGDHKVRFAGVDPARTVTRNVVWTGFEGANLAVEEGSNVGANSILSFGDFMRIVGSSADGTMALTNRGSDNNPSIIVGNQTGFHSNDLATAYVFSVAASRTRWKPAASTHPVMEVDSFGQIRRGPGNADPVVSSLLFGNGAPEGVTTAGQSSIYQDRGSTGLRSIWVKAIGTGNTGWVSVSPRYQTIATDAVFTLTPHTSPEQTRHTGTLTANRVVTLSTTNAQSGQTFRITRTGAGAFNLDIGGLKNLTTNQWCEVTYDGAAWYLAAFGSL